MKEPFYFEKKIMQRFCCIDVVNMWGRGILKERFYCIDVVSMWGRGILKERF